MIDDVTRGFVHMMTLSGSCSTVADFMQFSRAPHTASGLLDCPVPNFGLKSLFIYTACVFSLIVIIYDRYRMPCLSCI